MTQTEFPARSADSAPAEHIVQFYEDDHYLADAVAEFLASGLRAGGRAIVIARPEHRRLFADRLRRKGYACAESGTSGLITFADAAGTLRTFMRGTMPDEAQFVREIAPLLRSPSGNGHPSPPTRAYGEMVDVLWNEGNPHAAIRLEELWNALRQELAGEHPFSLLCTYPLSNFLEQSDGAAFDAICRHHSAVIPAESANVDGSATNGVAIARLQQRAAALEVEVSRRQSLEDSLRDAQERQEKIEKTLRRREQELRDAYRAKDDFLSSLSHELRTPLTAILGWAEMLMIGGLDQETVRLAVETIRASARTQAALLDELLDVSRIITGKFVVESGFVDLGPISNRALQMVQLAASAKSIAIEVRLPPQKVVVRGDATRLQQVVWNLLNNAVRFSRRGSVIDLVIESDAHDARIVVTDRGCGISPEMLPHVFEPFSLIRAESSRRHDGLGVGLAIVKYITELHGGTASAASEGADRGASFTITLPLAIESSRESASIAGATRITVDRKTVDDAVS